jgi:hypothetical protein
VSGKIPRDEYRLQLEAANRNTSACLSHTVRCHTAEANALVPKHACPGGVQCECVARYSRWLTGLSRLDNMTAGVMLCIYSGSVPLDPKLLV